MLMIMKNSPPLTPDWVTLNNDNKETYYNLLQLIETKQVKRAFKINTVGLYLYVIGYFFHILTGDSIIIASEIVVGVSLLTVSSIYILYKFNREGLSVKRYIGLISMLPKLSKTFLVIGVGFILATSAVFVSLEYPFEHTFNNIVYSSLPIIISMIDITLTYPLTRYRRATVHAKKKATSDNMKKAITQGTTKGDQNLPEDMPHPILEAIASQNTHPLALNYEQLGFLQEHNLIEEYFEEYSTQSSN